ncbi:MAG: ATP-binding cassette domain-containing protein [Candidatus Dormibacteraeota bacterium]|nr:ATP-binding cassette domain-containing protein [Candidatus Dormibacteraeota bacterium]
MDALSFAQLGYAYPGAGHRALRDVDLTIDCGLTLLTGDSGSGKSTLLRVCNGLVPHFHGGVISGRALVFGQDVTRTNTRRLARDVGFVFQDPELQSVHARVERDVAFGLENMRVPRGEMRARVDEALHLCGAEALRERSVATLSGGERQRVALAGVLAMRPRLLALDEPLSQLDESGARALVAAVAAAMERGTLAVVAEHRLALLRPLAQRVMEVSGGRLSDSSDSDAGPAMHATALTGRPGERPSPNHAHVRLHGVAAGHPGAVVLASVDLELSGGEVVAVIGNNGSGKTTLLRTIAGLLAPLQGRVERTAGRVAYLPQNPTTLLHRRTLRSEIEWTLRHGGGGGAGADAVDATLADFGLEHVAERYPRDLSTGERQRAALAAVLAGSPALALLDEPTRGMDATAAARLGRAVQRLAATGAAVVIATHDHDLATHVATRVVETRDGAVQEQTVMAAAPA